MVKFVGIADPDQRNYLITRGVRFPRGGFKQHVRKYNKSLCLRE